MPDELQAPNSLRPLLTIAVPTYNRACYLREFLSVLFDQIIGDPRIELIVSDNASPDKTPELVAEFQQRGLQLSYIRNEVNLGPDVNILQCFEQARGKYVWVFGDDDIIVPGSIAKILALLSEGEYGLVYVTPYGFRSDYIAERTSDKYGRLVEFPSNGVQFAQRVGGMINFISALIVNKDIYSTIQHNNPRDLVGTNLVQMGYLLPVLAHSSDELFIWERLIAGRDGNRSGWGICRVFGVNLDKILKAELRERKDLAAAFTNSMLRGWFPFMIMETRRGTAGALDREDVHGTLRPLYAATCSYWTHVYPLVRLPLGLAEIWYRALSIINRLRPSHVKHAMSTLLAILSARTVIGRHIPTKILHRRITFS